MRASTSSPLRFYRLFSAQPAFPPVPFSNLFSRLSTVKSSRLLRMDNTYTGDNPSSSRHRSPFSSSAFSGRSSGKGQRRDFGREVAPVRVDDRIDALGRLLTRILRHKAVELNLEIRSDGYVCVSDLLKLNLTTYAKVPLRAHTIEDIKEAVRINNKQRLSLLEENEKLLIRANQGHSIKKVTSESLLKPILSADELQVCVHGTYKKNLNSILQYGLKRMERLHVHFASGLPSDAGLISGMRRDVDILIFLDVRKALKDGMKLYISDNKVILTEGFEGIIPLDYFEKIETWPERAPIVTS